MFVVFLSHLARPAEVEAAALAPLLGVTEYEARLALVTPAPSIVQTTSSKDRANDVAAVLRARGHGAHVFDDDELVTSDEMIRLDDFRLDADGVRRVESGDLLPYGDVFAILRAVHKSSSHVERPGAQKRRRDDARLTPDPMRIVTKTFDSERVAYFFRRSGERPWLLRERHARYDGLGAERAPTAFTNFERTLGRIREAAAMSVYDDRLVRRRVAERLREDPLLERARRSSHDGIDLLAHLLAMAIANQGGSPYR